jgi:hypothetical protein
MLDSDIGFTKIGETEVSSTGVSGDSSRCTSAIVLFFRSRGGSSRGPRSVVSRLLLVDLDEELGSGDVREVADRCATPR